MNNQYECCQRVMATGEQCGSPALEGENLCYWHHKAQNRYQFREFTAPPAAVRPNTGIVLPTLEDANSIQIGIEEVMHAIIDNRIEPKRAGLLLYAMQLAVANVHRLRLVDKDSAITQVEDVTNVATDLVKSCKQVNTCRPELKTAKPKSKGRKS